MPAMLSKLLLPEWSFPYNCYEIGHTWTPYCSEAAIDIAFVVFRQSIRLYTPLYLGNQFVFQRKYDYKTFRQTFISILRSSMFLSFTGLTTLLLFCGIRRISDRFYWILVAWMPSFFANVLSVLIERPSRRGTLAIYCANIASETIYRIAVSRNYLKPIPNGEVIIFTISISLLLLLIRKNGYNNDPISIALKLIIGKEEAKKSRKLLYNNNCIQNNNNNEQNLKSVGLNKFTSILDQLNSYLPKHNSCPHQNSCLLYTLSAFFKPFLIGWFAQSGLELSSRPKKLFTKLGPHVIMQSIMSSRSLKFGLFVGCFASAFKTINCLLRWSCDASYDWHSLIAGLISGPLMLISPNSTIALYLMWKCIESLCHLANKNGYIKYSNVLIVLIYSLSTSQLFYTTILDPKCMKKSYMHFIERVTEKKLSQLNRIVLDVFGTGASAGYENFFPDLDLRFTSKKFQETILNWLI